jgi:hypothetical protein
MAAPTEPFNQANDNLHQSIVAPIGMSRLSVPSGGSLTVTFQAATSYVRVATGGALISIAWTADGQTNGARNEVGGDWPNPWAMPGQLDQLVLTDAAAAGAVPVDLAVMASPVLASRFPSDKSNFEGATEPHANS